MPFTSSSSVALSHPATSIKLGFDLSDFGIPNEPPKQRIIVPRTKPKSNKFYRAPVEEFPADFLDRIELPRIMRAPNLIDVRAPPM